ncbi:uncharacterized protein LOC113204074 [Frankliniella occidentalis]|uniref:Uncharacterized protein LOC113204074 n=1 Tax=Frankliniella occidentalis TaxID=133901 RepID=A0A6J1S126_FRAOC|nr:uncharacterized protein LOC113204074 [Frankliniella occidentalis]
MPLGCFTALLLLLLLLVGYRTSSNAEAASHFINSVAGPYRIIPDHIERCPVRTGGFGPLYKDIFWRGYHDRNNRDLWYYWVNFTTLLTFDDSYNVDLNWASWSSRGGWKENAYVMRLGSFCKVIFTHDPDLWRRLMIATFDDPNRNCPFPPGYYETKNISSEFSLKKIPVLFYGTWRITLHLFKESVENVVACFMLFGKTVPKS